MAGGTRSPADGVTCRRKSRTEKANCAKRTCDGAAGFLDTGSAARNTLIAIVGRIFGEEDLASRRCAVYVAHGRTRPI